MIKDIMFARNTSYRGRSGHGTMTGISANRFVNLIILTAFNLRGHSNAVEMEIPLENVKELIEALTELSQKLVYHAKRARKIKATFDTGNEAALYVYENCGDENALWEVKNSGEEPLDYFRRDRSDRVKNWLVHMDLIDIV